MRDEHSKILNGHGNGHDAIDLARHRAFDRYDSRDVLIRLRLCDPCDLLVVAGRAAESLIDRRVTIIQNDIVEVRQTARRLIARSDARETLQSQAIRVSDLTARQDMIDGKRRGIQDRLLRLQSEVTRQGGLKRTRDDQKLSDDGILRHELRIVHNDVHEIAQFAADEDGRCTGIAFVRRLAPNLRPEDPKRHMLLLRYADARSADLFDAKARAFDLTGRQTHEGQRAALQDERLSVEQQEAQAVTRKELLHALRQLQKAVDGRSMPLLQCTEILCRKHALRLRPHRRHVEPPALTPRLGHPRMHVDVDFTFVAKPLVIRLKLPPAALLPYHISPPSQPNVFYE